MPRFSIILPVYQEYGIFRTFWSSLLNTIQYSTEILLINDASPASTTSFINDLKYTEFPLISLKITEHATGMGYAQSVNEVLPNLSGDFVIFMDSDIILTDNWQKNVLKNLSDDSVGGMGCVLLYPQTGGIQNCGLAYTESLGRHLFLNNVPSILEGKGSYEVQSTVFAFFATHLNIVKSIGKLDIRYFNGYEDIDYQLRIRTQLHKRIVIDSSLRMYHWEQSNGFLRSYNRRSNLALLWKHHGTILINDIWNFLFEQFDKHILPDTSYIGVDLCSARLDADMFWTQLNQKYPGVVVRTDEYFHTICEDHTIWLPQVLPYDYFRTEQPLIFLCNNFINLLDNKYWLDFRERYCRQDIIIDLYGNVIRWDQLKDRFWPGRKIR